MTQFAGNKNAPAQLHKDLRVSQELVGTYNIVGDGNAIGTQKPLGVLQAGTLLNPTGLRSHIEEAFDGTTPALDVYLVPFSTGTVDANAILPTATIVPGTTGVKYSTAALVKTAGRHVRLTEKCWVIVVFTPGAADATAGKATFVLPFSHDLVSTSY